MDMLKLLTDLLSLLQTIKRSPIYRLGHLHPVYYATLQIESVDLLAHRLSTYLNLITADFLDPSPPEPQIDQPQRRVPEGASEP